MRLGWAGLLLCLDLLRPAHWPPLDQLGVFKWADMRIGQYDRLGWKCFKSLWGDEVLWYGNGSSKCFFCCCSCFLLLAFCCCFMKFDILVPRPSRTSLVLEHRKESRKGEERGRWFVDPLFSSDVSASKQASKWASDECRLFAAAAKLASYQ